MSTKRCFPSVHVSRNNNGGSYEGSLGLRLNSILKADLIQDQDLAFEKSTNDNQMINGRGNRRNNLREGLLHAISGLPSDVLIEIRIVAIPNIATRANGDLMINMFIRSSGQKKEAVREKVMAAFLSVNPILWSHVSEVEFLPIFDQRDLQHRLEPFPANYCVAVGRSKSMISLATPMKRLSIGFGPQEFVKTEDDAVLRHTYPWRSSHDSWAVLLNTLMGQMDPTELIIRLKPSKPDEAILDGLRSNLSTCEAFIENLSEKEGLVKVQAHMIRNISLQHLSELTTCCFDLGVYVVSERPVDPVLAKVVGRSITRSSADSSEGNFFDGGFHLKIMSPNPARSLTGESEEHGFTVSEAACAFRLPDPPGEDIPGLPICRSRTGFAYLNARYGDRSEKTRLFVNVHQGIEQEVAISMEDRFRHMFIIGQTGTGKSTLMESMILQDIRAGRGLGVIDPHGDMVDSILGGIPEHRIKDVVLFDLLEKEKPMGFNLIEWNTPEERDLIIDELYLTLDRLYNMKEVGGPIFESNFRGMLKLLMNGKTEGRFVPTLLDFTTCYLDDRFRDWLKNQTKDPISLDFVRELERTGGDASLKNLSPYITSKFSRFTSDTSLMRIVGQEKTGIDFDEVMNEGKVLLIKLGRGRFGPTVSALLANQIVARFKLTAMKRGEIRPEERRDFFLYVDECHNLPRENFMELLAEARKFRMGLVLATQYAAQLAEPGDFQNAFLSAILGNVGTNLIFRLGLQDAALLAPILEPQFTLLDITGLPNWNGYARLQTGHEPVPAFSFKTIKDEAPYNAELESKIKRACQLKYGVDCDAIDKQIQRRRSLWKQDEV